MDKPFSNPQLYRIGCMVVLIAANVLQSKGLISTDTFGLIAAIFGGGWAVAATKGKK